MDRPLRKVRAARTGGKRMRLRRHYLVGTDRRAVRRRARRSRPTKDEAEALDPCLPVWCVEERGVALYVQDRHREAIEQLCALPFQTKRSRLYQIAARMALGEIDQAQKLARTALALQPDLTTKYVRDQEWYRDRDLLEKLVQRLIEAGVPRR